jgi:AraC-like DNA-binding protein
MRATGAASVPNRVLPDGCSDIIIGLGDHPAPVAVGTMRAAEVFPLTGSVDFVGIRFRPGRGHSFVGVPLHEITDCRIALDALWGSAARALTDVAPDARISCAERVLRERLRTCTDDGRVEELLVSRAIALLRQSRGGASIRAVASALGIGERRLQRAFDRSVGVSPKALDRVLRLQRVVRRIDAERDAGAPASWTAIAFDAGYADQSHLIREFRSLAGVTPGGLARERGAVGFVQSDEVESP